DRGRRSGRRPRRTVRGHAGAGGEGRPVVAARIARVDQGGLVIELVKNLIKHVVRIVNPHLYGEPGETRTARNFRRMRIAIVIAACLVTLQSLLLVLGAWRNDRQIQGNMGVAAAEVLSAGPRRSTIEFVTPDRVT